MLSLSLDARRCDHRARGRRPPGRGQERHRERGVLPGPFPGHTPHARRPDARIAVPGGGPAPGPAGRPGTQYAECTCEGSTTRSFAARSSRAIGCGSRSRWAGGASSLALAQATAYLDDQVVAECELLLGLMPDRAQIDPSAIVHPAAQIGAGTVIGPHATDRSSRAHRRRLPCGRVRRSSTAGPRSATAPRSIRSPRSASCRRTSSSRARKRAW